MTQTTENSVRMLPALTDTHALANRLGCSIEAVELCRASPLIDLHLDTYIPKRLWGYDIGSKNTSPFGGRFFGQSDVPRLMDGGANGGMWSLTTNPFRTARGRWTTFNKNFEAFCQWVDEQAHSIGFARNKADYDQLQNEGRHAVFLSIQGGNALDAAPDTPGAVTRGLLMRVTLVHLTNARFGASSSPIHILRRRKGLSTAGKVFVEKLNAERIFVDLAHIHPQGFWDAIDVHDRHHPVLVTHTGVCGVTPHWRNLDDRQLRAVADRGGVVGIMNQASFLKRRGGPKTAAMLVEHMEHVARVAGQSAVALGTDFDGAIIPPRDFRSADAYPVLVQHMLDRGWSSKNIQGALGGNFLRVLEAYRPS